MRLWQRLGDVKGASFLNQFGAVGESAFETWTAGLADLSPEQIRHGFASFMRSTEEYLDLKKFRAFCMDLSRFGLPELRQAYEEACMAASPKDRQKWSHPAVYHAGKNTGWHELACTPTDQIFPRFEYHYAELCKRVIAGESLELPVAQAIASRIPKVLTREENISRMAALRAETGL